MRIVMALEVARSRKLQTFLGILACNSFKLHCIDQFSLTDGPYFCFCSEFSFDLYI